MSYFHEYSNKHRKTLRTYSEPVDLRAFAVEDVGDQRGGLLGRRRRRSTTRRTHRLLTPVQARNLMPRDATELRADDLVQYESARPQDGRVVTEGASR